MTPDEAPVSVVAGAGIAGLLAVEAVRHLGPVVLVEPDSGWEEGVRPGVPHGRQLHNLLGRAQRHLEELVPGVLTAIAEAGAVHGSVADETLVVEYGREMPRRDVGLVVWSVTRQGLEEALVDRISGDGVTRVRGSVVGVEVDADGVTGAVIRSDERTTLVPSQLLVDASGRRAAGLRWLDAAGLPAPETTSLTTRQWYASVIVRATPSPTPFAMVFPTARCPYGGLVSPAGPGWARVSLNGGVGGPPRTLADVQALADRLEHPVVAAALAAGSVAGRVSGDEPPEVHAFGAPQARWHRYDRLDDPVPGLMPVGDAVAHLSPLFGQGVSGAAWEAAGLRSAVLDLADRAGATRDYLAHTGRVRQTMWDLMTVQDPGGPGDLDEEQTSVLVDRLIHDPVAHTSYVAMWHLLAPLHVLPALARGDAVDAAWWGVEGTS